MRLFILFTIIILACQKQYKRLDISDVVIEAKKIADSTFHKDAMGNPYNKKYWETYCTFVNKSNLALVLNDYAGNGVELIDTTYRFFIDKKNESSITSIKRIKANLPFNYILIQRPVYIEKEHCYSSVIWIRDKSWTSGFIVVFSFKILDGKCKFLKGTPLIVSDIQEFNE